MSRDPNGKTLYREKHVQGPGDSNGPAGSGGARRAARLRERGRGAAGGRGPRGSGGRSAGGLGTTARPLRPPGGATRKQEREWVSPNAPAAVGRVVCRGAHAEAGTPSGGCHSGAASYDRGGETDRRRTPPAGAAAVRGKAPRITALTTDLVPHPRPRLTPTSKSI